MKCGIIKDLLPSYIDRLTCEDSNTEIEKHLNECQECKTFYQQMLPPESMLFESEEEKQQDLQVLKSFKKMRRKIIKICIITAVIVVAFVVAASCALRYERHAMGYVPYEQLRNIEVVVTEEKVEMYYESPDSYENVISMLQHDFYVIENGETKNILLIGGYTNGGTDTRNIKTADLSAGATVHWDVITNADLAIYDLKELDAVYYFDYWTPEFIDDLFDETGENPRDAEANEQILQILERDGHLIYSKTD